MYMTVLMTTIYWVRRTMDFFTDQFSELKYT